MIVIELMQDGTVKAYTIGPTPVVVISHLGEYQAEVTKAAPYSLSDLDPTILKVAQHIADANKE